MKKTPKGVKQDRVFLETDFQSPAKMTDSACWHRKRNLQIEIWWGCKTPVSSRMKATCSLLVPFTKTGLPDFGKLLGKANLEHSSPFGGSHTHAHLVTPLLAGNPGCCNIGCALVKLAIATVASPWEGKKKTWGQGISDHVLKQGLAIKKLMSLYESIWQHQIWSIQKD